MVGCASKHLDLLTSDTVDSVVVRGDVRHRRQPPPRPPGSWHGKTCPRAERLRMSRGTSAAKRLQAWLKVRCHGFAKVLRPGAIYDIVKRKMPKCQSGSEGRKAASAQAETALPQ